MLALATPFLLAAAVVVFGSLRARRGRRLDPFVIALQVAGVVLLVIAVLGQPRGGPLLTNDYFDPYLVSVPNLIAGVVIGLLLTAAALRPPRLAVAGGGPGGARSRTAWRWVALAIAIAVTVIWLLPAVNTDDTAPRAGSLASGHIPVQGDDYFSAVNGRTPLVNYISQYANLLPLALEPVLKAAGPSITSLSISMCVLSAIAMIAIYGAFAVVTRGAWTALALYVPWVALSLFPWNDVGPYREFNGIYYGVFPGRYFGPFLLALLCAISLRRRRPSAYLLFLFAGLVLLNNYEFGIGALLALIAGLAAGWDPRSAGAPGSRRRAAPGRPPACSPPWRWSRDHADQDRRAARSRPAHLLQPHLPPRLLRPRADVARSACTGLSTPPTRQPCWSLRCASSAVSRIAS